MASFQRVKLPDDDKENWDSTLISHDTKDDCILCPLAIAQGAIVYSSHWQTKLDHVVGRLCSNANGTIVVASTQAGTVSLLDATNGSLLATRKVSNQRGSPAAEISFVAQQPQSSSTTSTASSTTTGTKDTLVIVVPDDASTTSDTTSTTTGSTQVILVSNIDGHALNNADTIAYATRSMSIEALSIPIPHISGTLQSTTTTVLGKGLRFAAVSPDGKLALFDYQDKVVTAVPLQADLTVDSGLVIQQHAATNNVYLIFCTNGKKSSTITWFNALDLTVSCQMELPARVVRLEPLESCCPESALALVAATKDTLCVVQVAVEETMGLAILKDSHYIYRIPCGSVVHHLAATPSGPYSFRVSILVEGVAVVCKEFTTTPLVGHVRLLLHQRRFDEATTKLIEEYTEEDDFSQFHPTEIALRRLEHVLQGGSMMSPETLMVAQQCLQRLSQLDGNDLAVENLLQAADAIYNWPRPKLSAYCVALTAICTTLGHVEAPPIVADRIQKKKMQLEDCHHAMQALSDLLKNSADADLDGSFSNVRSTADLFRVLLSEGLFGAATSLQRQGSHRLVPEVVVSSIVSLAPPVDPRGYVPLLEAGILGLHTVKHSLLPTVCAWACGTADALVAQQDGAQLESAIFLLQHVLDAMNQLHAKLYSSFASFCPFVETRSQTSPREAGASFSFRSSDDSASEQQRPVIGSKKSIDQPVPTILELGRLKGGALKSNRIATVRSNVDDDDDDDCDDIEVKLRHAKVLQKARDLGLKCDAASLRQFSRKGGASYLALEVVRLFSSTCGDDHEKRLDLLHNKIKQFCDESDVCFDEIVFTYQNQVCDSKKLNQSMLVEATSLARCCIKNSMKCKVTLVVLRAALLCGAATPCLTTLSKDAIDWAGGDLSMRSELTEATRLLVINSIAVTYCGTDAALELFRVDNPSHAVRLLAHVCRHVTYVPALSDALKLCDAFTHLTKEDACIQMLETAIYSSTVDVCSSLLTQVFDHDSAVARPVWTRALEFCSVTMLDTCEKFRGSTFRDSERDKVIQLCKKGLALLEVVQELVPTRSLKATPFEELLNSYQRVRRLQNHHEVFVSPLELDCRDVQLRIVSSLVADIRKQFDESSSLSLFEQARRAAQLLIGSCEDDVSAIWFSAVEQEACKLVWSVDDALCVQFLVQSGALNALSTEEAAQAVLSVVLNFCKRASQGAQEESRDIVSQMKLVLRASQLLHDFVLKSCPPKLLSSVSSLSVLTEAAGRVLLLADNGVGDELEAHRRQLRLWNCNLSAVEKQKENRATYKKPFLHSSWYVGDGLLLPLDDTHGGCVEFCMDLVGLILCDQPPTLQGSEQLHRLLNERGAHSAALRVGCLTMANVLSSSVFKPADNYQKMVSFSSSYQNTLKCLAERSLGGSGNGITNPKVDSELALSYLHLLPTKLAFKVYQSCLPSAITKRDFRRVRTLSDIGVVAGRGRPGDTSSYTVPRSWKKQAKFVEQCERLSMRARWWITLQRFQVDFDPRRFEDSSSSTEVPNPVRKESQYSATLLEALIANCCKEFNDADAGRKLATSFSVAFGVDTQVASQKHAEFMLSCPQDLSDDLRSDLGVCEKATRVSLKDISSPMKRAALLRKALVELEGNENYQFDYERHGLLLTLYQEELSKTVESDSVKKKIDITPFAQELEAIERRKDALTILMSFFEGDKRSLRPSFIAFFVPLHIVFGGGSTSYAQKRVGVLGPDESKDGDLFDPLAPLQDFLSFHADSSTATALAPLCVPLSLPLGYIHARTLVARFHQAQSSGCAMPLLETDVLPVLNRLKSFKDQAILTEWCATIYEEHDDQKMQCLDIALEYAMKASGEMEQRARRHPTVDHESGEKEALDMVRRISNNKSTLSDKKQVNDILETSKYGDADHFRAVKKIIDDLATRLNEELWKQADAAPDTFVELFLTEASSIAAEACLTVKDSFTLDHLRYMASVVHKACKEISEQYSHVHSGALCRKLARRWLIHGDSLMASKESEAPIIRNKISEMVSFEEEDDETVNFVMDLNELGDGEQFWSEDVASSDPSQRDATLVTKEEEPSALDIHGSAREMSEIDCAKVALRIAFVMSYAEGYHPKAPESPTSGIENSGDNNNKRSFEREGTKKKRRGLLARLPGDSSHDNMVMDHGRELLRIVFAKSGSSSKERINDTSVSFLSTGGNDGAVKAATFSIRYRALRTAAILCPQEALERIIKEEAFLQGSSVGTSCTLRQCTFGAFVAKEIEEMGLVLPHSDLAQLSTMQYSSYARAIRRNHDTNSLRTKGRLLLLMVEMSSVPGQGGDESFVSSVLSEMRLSRLPRSLLLACERYCDFAESTKRVDLLNDLSSCAAALTEICLKEARNGLCKDKISTLSRVATLVQKMSVVQPKVLHSFAEGLLDLASVVQEKELQSLLGEMVAKCISYIDTASQKSDMLEKLSLVMPVISTTPVVDTGDSLIGRLAELGVS